MTSKNKKQPPDKEGRITVLRWLREKAGLTREALTARLGNRIAVSTWARWENQPKEPSMTREDWGDFCEAVGVPFDQLPKSLVDWAPLSEEGNN